MATTEESVIAALELNANGSVSVSVDSRDGDQLVRIQSSSARVGVFAYVDDTATAGDVQEALRDLARELEYQTGVPAQGGRR